MDTSYFSERSNTVVDALSPSIGVSSPTVANANRSNALSTRISSVLSSSYADLDLRDALQTLDSQKFTNTQDSRRNLRLDLQQDVIQANGEIIKDFGLVADVR